MAPAGPRPISAAARDEISAVLGLPSGAFDVVHLGVDDAHVAATPEPRLRAKYELEREGEIVLCVGAYRPHKNQELLIRALSALERETVLVLLGPPERGWERLEAVAS